MLQFFANIPYTWNYFSISCIPINFSSNILYPGNFFCEYPVSRKPLKGLIWQASNTFHFTHSMCNISGIFRKWNKFILRRINASIKFSRIFIAVDFFCCFDDKDICITLGLQHETDTFCARWGAFKNGTAPVFSTETSHWTSPSSCSSSDVLARLS